MKNIAFFFFCWIASSSQIVAQSPPGVPPAYLADSLQKILDASLPAWANNPGVMARIDVPGRWSWVGHSGSAISGITAGSPATPAADGNVFRMGSISKIFTAVAILKLEEAGLLSTDDDIALYLRPTLVADTIQSSDTVYIRHLLNHTSGIDNSSDNNVCRIDALNDPTRFFPLEELIYCGASLGEMFTPGTNWSYSNTNYSILAMIIEDVTGMPFNDYITDSILVPAGLNSIYIPTTDSLLLPHSGCYYNFGAPIGLVDLTIVDESLYRGWASMVGDLEGLNTFFDMLRNGQIISPASFDKMIDILPAASNYGFAIEHYNIGTGEYYGHSGDVGTTNGLFYCDLQTIETPNGYYISYNYNYSGVNSIYTWDVPVYNLLKNYLVSVDNTAAKPDAISVFPNPAAGFIHVDNASNQAQNAVFYNMMGQEIAKTQLAIGINKIDVNTFESGVYILKTTNHSAKFVKE